MINHLLQFKQPDEWDDYSYSNCRFMRTPLQDYSREFNEVKSLVKTKSINSKIVKIERIQHPFSYGRFLIRCLQVEKLLNAIPEITNTFYYVTNPQKIEEILEFNCDLRRGGFNTNSTTAEHIIICKTLENHYRSKRDSDSYPAYLITCDVAQKAGSSHFDLANALWLS